MGKSQSELIRAAVDDMIDRLSSRSRRDVLDQTACIWKNRDDLGKFDKLRESWDRNGA